MPSSPMGLPALFPKTAFPVSENPFTGRNLQTREKGEMRKLETIEASGPEAIEYVKHSPAQPVWLSG